MATLSQAQVAVYAQSAGLSPAAAQTAAAVAMAESGGNPRAHNAVPPDDSYGLWQINMLGGMGPSRRSKLGISSNEALYDPATNARAMAMISNGGSSFGAWSTYTSGAYKKFLGGAAGATDPGATDAGYDQILSNPFAPFTGLVDALRGINAMAELAIHASIWIANPRNWVRTAQVGTGALLVGVGLAVMTRGTWQPVATAASKVARITPAGRVTAAAGVTKTVNTVRSGGRGVKPRKAAA